MFEDTEIVNLNFMVFINGKKFRETTEATDRKNLVPTYKVKFY